MIKKILVVDDSPVARKMLIKCIPGDKGYAIEEAENGLVAVEKYQTFEPDLTFMDLTMPVMDGFEAVEKIIACDRKAIIVVMTADIQPKAMSRVVSLGAYVVLRKPPRPQPIKDILERVENRLEKMSGGAG